MTKLSAYVNANVIDNKAIVLTAAWGEVSLKVFGATMPIGSRSKSSHSIDAQNHVTLYPEEGKEGVVAVVIIKRPSSSGKAKEEPFYIAAFLKVVWKDKDGKKYPFLDIDEPWVSAERIGQVTTNTIEVVLPNGKRFCWTDALYHSNNRSSLPSLVPDADLLCRYLFGTASAADVLHAAVEHRLEPTLRKRVELLTQEVAIATNRQTTLKRENEWLMDAAALQFEKSKQLLALRDKLQEAINAGNCLWTTLNTLPTKIQPKWFKSFKQKLEEYHRLREVQLY